MKISGWTGGLMVMAVSGANLTGQKGRIKAENDNVSNEKPSQSDRAAFRQAKRDVNIPTSETHSNHKKVASDRFDKSKSGTEYTFSNNKKIQKHPNGHPQQGVNKRHFNNHQPSGQTGGTKNHYTYP